MIHSRARGRRREGIIAVMDQMRERDAVDGIVLGGTELPLLLRDMPYSLPLLETMRIHVDAVVDDRPAPHADRPGPTIPK